jgi:hypothetical protein
MFEHARAQLEKARRYLAANPHLSGPSISVSFIRDLPELHEAELDTLAWLCWRGDFGCYRSDAHGLFELFESWMDEKETRDVLDV